MYRPPRHVRPPGGMGGSRPPSYFPPNPNFPYPYNLQNYRNPTSTDPFFLNPVPPSPNRPYIQNPSFSPPNPSANAQQVLGRVETAVARAHQDILAAGESVTSWKVSQKAMLSLQVDSWSWLGFQIQEIPYLHRLIITEGKINAFIHCFVGVRRITSMHDLDVAICKSEGIERFEMLGLGPLLRHPLVVHYFSVPLEATEVFRITSEDIVSCLGEFMDTCKKMVTAEEFMNFLAEKHSCSTKEKLGLRIQSLGLYITYIKEAKKAENATINKYLEVLKHNFDKESRNLQKEVLDRRFDFISERVKSFSPVSQDLSGKHIRFDSSDEDTGSDSDGQNQSLSHDKPDSRQHVSSCPYPSTSEEMARLGLKSEITEKTSLATGMTRHDEGKKSSGKKRKLIERYCNGSSLSKLVKKDIDVKEDDKKSLCDPTLPSNMMAKFITTWKEACREHLIVEVLERMLSFYNATVKQKKRMRKIFSSYPGVGLLNVAVRSMKCGMQDSIYDTFQSIGEHGFISPGPSQSNEMIDIGPSAKGHPISNNDKSIQILHCSVTVDDIIKKFAEYFELHHLGPIKKELPLEKQFTLLKNFRDCEIWLTTQFSVEEFCSLGYGDFFEFLESNVSLLPYEMHRYFIGDQCEKSPLEVSMLQDQLKVFLSQAKSNSLENDIISGHQISMLLIKQFPTVSFHIMGNEPDKYILDSIKKQNNSDSSRCVLFSTTLLGKSWVGKSLAHTGKHPSEVAGMMSEVNQYAASLGSVSAKGAIECLLKAPMLSDLQSWSHWDIIFAPSLGPLLEWLLNEFRSENLTCIATSDGKLIRIDHSASIDEFLEASIQGSSFQAAVKFLSLLALYGGTSKVPLSLLKCYAQRALDVILRNSTYCIKVNIGDGLMDRTSLQGQVDSNAKPPPPDFLGTGTISQGNGLWQRSNKAVNVASKFILDFLGHLPAEFRNFAAEVLVSGLKSFSKDAHLIILHECKQIDQRFMLHDIGLSLRITEWVEDYCAFSSATAADSMMFSKNLNNTPGSHASEKLFPNNGKILPGEAESTTVDGHRSTVGELHKSKFVNEGLNEKPGDDHGSIMCEDREIQDATLVVESIRHEEFGLDPNLKYAESSLLKKQHARLGRALHCLSQELYSQDSHLLLELIQNADDNIYAEAVEPTLAFILQDTGIVVLNNEQGFSAQNIRALCDIGNSTKKGSGAGYIGHKGIGFKSVFRVTDSPQIHSNGFHVKFDITEGKIGFVLPTVIPPCDINIFERQLSTEVDQTNVLSWKTCIVLPFRSKLKGGTGMSSIVSMFSDLHPSLLLFLHRLRCIKFKNLLNDTLVVLKRETMEHGIVKVSHGKEKMSWLLVSQKLQASIIRPDVQTTEIAIAFTLQDSSNGEYKSQLSQQPVFAFLPLRTYGLKFILQGDFVLPSSREEVDGDSAWNQWLLSEFPALFVSAERSFCSLPCFKESPGKAVTTFMDFVPLVGEVHGFFSHLPHMIISKLRMSNCLLLEGLNMEWVPPCRVLRSWDEQARILLPDNLLKQHLGLGYLNKDIILSDGLARALGIKDYGPKILTEILSSICHGNEGLKLLGLDWLSSWFTALSTTLLVHSAGNISLNAGMESDLINSLRKIPFIPLSDGTYSSVAEGPIWLPCDSFSIGFDGKHSPKDFPSLYSKLRTVNPLLFSASSSYTCRMDVSGVDNVVRILHKIGVQQLSAHEVIKTHILPTLSDNRHIDTDRNLMTDYLSFVMLHLQYTCPSCHIEKEGIIFELRKNCIILTNNGYKCPIKEPVHFSREFGNPVNVYKLIEHGDNKWHEVDTIYLKHPGTQSLSSALIKWREFFLELGVTDFVQVIHTEKNVSDFSSISSRSMMCDGDHSAAGLLVSDWESPELVRLLSTLSSDKYREKCKYLLEVLDKMWDDCFTAKVRANVNVNSIEDKIHIESSFMKSLHGFKWIASSMDDELHYPEDLYYDCEAVRSILGIIAPYAVPQVSSKMLLQDIGFKTQVTVHDALTILRSWRMSEVPFVGSTVQMSKFYNFIWDEIAKSKENITEEFKSNPSIFIPFSSTSKCNDAVPGIFLLPNEVYWYDPTGCVDRTKEMIFHCASMTNTTDLSCKALAAIYPGLHDFFVNECAVHEIPPFSSYLQMLLQLSSVALPSQAAHAVFRVFLKWADDLKSGTVKAEEIFNLKESLSKLETTVLPTVQDKWVSLHPSFGLICWSDDEELRQQFKHSYNVDFLQFSVLNNEEKEMLFGKVARLMQTIGIPALSEVVFREAIFYGTEDNREKASLVNWVLPYAQRYIHKLYPDTYLRLKQLGFEKLSQLQVVVVENLFYKHTLRGQNCSSTKRFECSCLLQENILYTARSSDSHSMFMELSRAFFDGSAELHLANFLHMITTMAESGSTEEQTEFFIVNSQKVPKLPVDEPVWSLLSLSSLHEDKICTVPVTTEQKPSSSRKPGINPNWPPTNWKTAPGFPTNRKTAPGFDFSKFRTRLFPGPYDNLLKEFGKPPEEVTGIEDIPVSVEIDGDWIVEDDRARMAMILQDLETVKDQSHLVESSESVDRQSNHTIVPSIGLAGSVTDPALDTSFINMALDTERNRLCLQTPNENQARRTGRLGELIAYKYFSEKLSSVTVKWVNEETETGLPYDLIIEDKEENREYIEVKATKSTNKDWFAITTREWQFAVEKLDSFTIAHVVLAGPKNAKITIFKNPLKLCQQNMLHLAVLMSQLQ